MTLGFIHVPKLVSNKLIRILVTVCLWKYGVRRSHSYFWDPQHVFELLACAHSHGRGCHRGLGSTSSRSWRERQPVSRQKEGVKNAVPPAQRGNAAFPQQKRGLQVSQARLFKVWVALFSRHLTSAWSLLFHTQVPCRLVLVLLSPLSPLSSCTVPTLTKYCACYQCQFWNEHKKAKTDSNNYRKLKCPLLFR